MAASSGSRKLAVAADVADAGVADAAADEACMMGNHSDEAGAE